MRMAASNYDKMSLKELKNLQDKVSDALGKAKVKRKSELKDKVLAMVQKEGFTIEELFGIGKKTGKKIAGVPKYRDPKDASKTWTGKGKRPGWMNELLSKGHDKDEFLI